MRDDWKPIRLSPLHHRLIAAGAVLTETGGWLQAEHFGDPDAEAGAIQSAAGMLDRSAAHKLELKGKTLHQFLASILGGTSPVPGCAAIAEWGYACRITSEHAILVAKDTSTTVPVSVPDEPSRTNCVYGLERTNGYGVLWVCGPAAVGVLRKLTSLDIQEKSFPNLSCAVAPLAAVRAVIVRKDATRFPGYEVLFSREYGEYLWDVTMEAGLEFGLRPFGLAAASRLDPH